jgi:uncharacterized protein YybS (DUF2232 family)
MLAEIFFYGIIIYLVYKLVFDLIMPVSSATKQMKQQFRDVHTHMQEQANPPRQQEEAPKKAGPKSGKVVGDYIDFEEVKE